MTLHCNISSTTFRIQYSLNKTFEIFIINPPGLTGLNIAVFEQYLAVFRFMNRI